MTLKSFAKLSANENCYGCSPKVFDAIFKKYKEVSVYPEVNPTSLKGKLAALCGVEAENIIIGAGSVRIIDGLIQTFVKEGEQVITFEKSFVAYSQISKIYNRKCILAPLTDLRCLPQNIIPLVSKSTKIIFIANPNNPTGTIISHIELENLLKHIPSNIYVVIDEAYAEYVTDSNFPDSLQLQKKYQNLIILRSFSKIYGLAGLRVGYAIMDSKIATILNTNQIPFYLNYLSSDAAIAALSDKEFINKSSQLNSIERDYLYYSFIKLGFNTIASQANFVYLWFNDENLKEKVLNKLVSNQFIICDLKIFGQSKSLRITVGKAEINKKIIEILSK